MSDEEQKQLEEMLSKAIEGYDKILTTNADSGAIKKIAQEHLDRIIHNKK
jgi:hypothetical protein